MCCYCWRLKVLKVLKVIRSINVCLCLLALRIQAQFKSWSTSGLGGSMCSDSESAGGSSESRSMDSPPASPGDTERLIHTAYYHMLICPLTHTQSLTQTHTDFQTFQAIQPHTHTLSKTLPLPGDKQISNSCSVHFLTMASGTLVSVDILVKSIFI